jgi:hypothetical protein
MRPDKTQRIFHATTPDDQTHRDFASRNLSGTRRYDLTLRYFTQQFDAERHAPTSPYFTVSAPHFTRPYRPHETRQMLTKPNATTLRDGALLYESRRHATTNRGVTLRNVTTIRDDAWTTRHGTTKLYGTRLHVTLRPNEKRQLCTDH